VKKYSWIQIAASRVARRFRKKQQGKTNTFFPILQTRSSAAFACIFEKKCLTSGDARFQRGGPQNGPWHIKNKNMKR
jgi:hypothetical protein